VSGTVEAFDASSFQAALATSLNISVARVRVVNVTAGSVLISVEITATSVGETTPLLVRLTGPAFDIEGFELFDAPLVNVQVSCGDLNARINGAGAQVEDRYEGIIAQCTAARKKSGSSQLALYIVSAVGLVTLGALARCGRVPFQSRHARTPTYLAIRKPYDCFLSYRVATDRAQTEALYAALTALGLKVWYDRKCLKTGQKWEDGFVDGLLDSVIVVPVLSCGVLESMAALKKRSKDNVLLEHAFALELFQRGEVKGIIPALFGATTTAGYQPFFAARASSGDACDLPNVAVKPVQQQLRKHLNRLQRGTPLSRAANTSTVAQIEEELLAFQGIIMTGEEQRDIDAAAQQIAAAVKLVKDGPQLSQHVDTSPRERRSSATASSRMIRSASMGSLFHRSSQSSRNTDSVQVRSDKLQPSATSRTLESGTRIHAAATARIGTRFRLRRSSQSSCNTDVSPGSVEVRCRKLQLPAMSNRSESETSTRATVSVRKTVSSRSSGSARSNRMTGRQHTEASWSSVVLTQRSSLSEEI